MAFYKRDQYLDEKPAIERLYLFSIRFESGMECVKIGKSSGSSSLDRMLQIQRDYFNRNRCTFICRIVRDRPIDKDVFKYESALHRFFEDYRYRPKIAFDGSTELFNINKEEAIEAYEYLLDNRYEALDSYSYEPTTKECEDSLPF